ncbi:hypothetical protein SISSUDRAFT_1066019 [Sistotremastrum suecicum HHB10207 ss-3]|uniref:F-box domain-containing protein n=1 Tax=Sistotremastrum suecicum HHB10207 ss-3 TaxID=1314776 RepID=A0A165YTJ4_9AGAM|nr:hypothetical protein SISSUDRAFT_1066019 [Sistotremastrum suecicum HHB10207 ss-3]
MAQTASTAFWEIPELIARTTTFFDYRSLVALSQVSKSLSEHALDALFRECINIFKLFEILCPLKINRKTQALEFDKSLTAKRWKRFEHYRRRTRIVKIDLNFGTIQTISPKVISQLRAQIPAGEPFLPSLNKMHWESDNPGSYQFVELFVHDRLRELFLSIAGSDVSTVLGKLVPMAPNLESLKLIASGEIDDVPRAQTAAINAINLMTSLRSCALPSILVTPDMIRILSYKKSVKQLWLAPVALFVGRKASTRDVIDNGIIPERFPSLTELAINSARMLDFLPYFSDGHKLRTLHIDIEDQTRLRQTLNLIASSCKALTNFSLRLSDSIPEDLITSPLTMEILQPLLSLHLIEILVIEHPLPPSLNDADMEQFATSFPELQYLELFVQSGCRNVVQTNLPTLGCLIPFAQHCRKLIALGIYMDARHIPPPPPVQAPHTKFAPCFERLEVHCSPIDEPLEVRDFLATIIPPDTKVDFVRFSKWLSTIDGKMSRSMINSVMALDHIPGKYREEWIVLTCLFKKDSERLPRDIVR